MSRPPSSDPVDQELAERVLAAAGAAGLEHVGLCDAEPFVQTRAVLEQRREEGLSGGMQFTYRRPERSTDPSRTLPGARSLVVAALGYAAPVPPAGPGPQGRVARYATRDHYAVLRSALEQVADLLRAEGHASRVLVDDNALVDRAAAVRAGLGWYGKSANVLLPGHGSWFVLGSVLTDAALSHRPAPLADGCGSCTRCLDGCPTGAIVAPGVVDARRCLAWLVQAEGALPHELRVALDDRVYGCDECQEVCPPSRREEQRRVDADGGTAQRRGDAEGGTAQRRVDADGGTAQRSWVDLVWMLSASDDELMGELGQWYVPRRDPRYLRRNALVALGNSVATRHRELRHDDDVEGVLVRHLDGDDELLVSHATWAALRMDRHDLVRSPARMARPAVLAELDRWPDGPGRGETGRR